MKNISYFPFFFTILVTFEQTGLSFRVFSKLYNNGNQRHLKSTMLMTSSDPIPVMVNGLPGLMALETAMSCIDHGLNLIPYGFTGGDITKKSVNVQGKHKSVDVELVRGPGTPENKAMDVLKSLKAKYPNMVVIDYTHPSAVLNNIDCYVACNTDFVMGTTGGDPQKIQDIFSKGSNKAIISPNMAKQIVALQASLLETSRRYPNSFKNYKLTVTESHQSSKADTSGTAKALVAYISALTGEQFSFEDIIKLRDRDSQLKFEVPENNLGGHAFHTYTLKSADGSVTFELKHNVCGRRVYADGTVDGVKFLDRIRNDGSFAVHYANKRLFNMIDVLESEKF